MKHGRWLLSLMAGWALVFPGSVLAEHQDAVEMERMVVTSTLTPKQIEKAPGAIQVITGDEIRELGAETAADALAEATNIDLDHVAGRGTIPQIRGMSNKRVLILIDGMRFSTGFRDTTVDLSEFPSAVIDHIEIVRGPSSSLYGSEAVGGVINIITKKAQETVQAHVDVRYGMNTYSEGNNFIAKGTLGGTAGALGMLIAGHANVQDSFDRDERDDMTEMDDEKKYGGIVKLDYAISDDHALAAGAFATDTNRQGLRPKYTLHWDRDADSRRFSGYFGYTGEVMDTQLAARAYFSDFNLDRSYIDTGAPYASPERQKKANKQPDREDFDITNQLYQYEARASRLFGENHRITLGLEYREETREGIENRGETEIDKTVDNTAVFLQDDFVVFDALQITPGIRVDEHSDFGSELSPRVSLVYDVRPHFRIKASYGQGFRTPSIYELYVDTENMKGDVISNPDLDPETSRSYDVGIEGETGAFTGKLMAFRNEIDDMIYRQPTGNFRMQGKKKVLEYRMVNVDEAYTQGVEFEGRLQLPMDLSVAANGAFVESENNDTGEDLLEVPEFKGGLKLAYDNSSAGFHVNVRMNYIGEQLYAPKFHDAPGREVDAYTLWSCYISKSFGDRFEIFGGVDNMFNEESSVEAADAAFYYTGLSLAF